MATKSFMECICAYGAKVIIKAKAKAKAEAKAKIKGLYGCMERLIYFYPMSRMEELEAMLEESPDDPFLIYALAREYEAQQNTMQALLMYEHLVTNFPDYIATYFHYAKLLFGAGNRNAAIALLEQGIKAGSQKKEAHQVNEMKSLLASWAYGEEEQ